MLYGFIIFIKKTGQDGSKFPVTERSIHVGRGEECGIRIINPHVSHLQCELIVGDNDQAQLRNLCVSNPTILNSKLLVGPGDFTLQHGDIIQFGERLARWEYLPSSKFYASSQSSSTSTNKLVAVVPPLTPHQRSSSSSFSGAQASCSRDVVGADTDPTKRKGRATDDNLGKKIRKSFAGFRGPALEQVWSTSLGRHSLNSAQMQSMPQAATHAKAQRNSIAAITKKPATPVPTLLTPNSVSNRRGTPKSVVLCSGSKSEKVLKRKSTPMKATPNVKRLSPVEKLVRTALVKSTSKAPSLNTILETSPLRVRQSVRSSPSSSPLKYVTPCQTPGKLTSPHAARSSTTMFWATPPLAPPKSLKNSPQKTPPGVQELAVLKSGDSPTFVLEAVAKSRSPQHTPVQSSGKTPRKSTKKTSHQAGGKTPKKSITPRQTPSKSAKKVGAKTPSKASTPAKNSPRKTPSKSAKKVGAKIPSKATTPAKNSPRKTPSKSAKKVGAKIPSKATTPAKNSPRKTPNKSAKEVRSISPNKVSPGKTPKKIGSTSRTPETKRKGKTPLKSVFLGQSFTATTPVPSKTPVKTTPRRSLGKTDVIALTRMSAPSTSPVVKSLIHGVLSPTIQSSVETANVTPSKSGQRKTPVKRTPASAIKSMKKTPQRRSLKESTPQRRGTKRKLSPATYSAERAAKKLKIKAPTRLDKNKKKALLVLSKASRNQKSVVVIKKKLVKKAIKQSHKVPVKGTKATRVPAVRGDALVHQERPMSPASEKSSVTLASSPKKVETPSSAVSGPTPTSLPKKTATAAKSPEKSQSSTSSKLSGPASPSRELYKININSIFKDLPSPSASPFTNRRSSKRISSKNDVEKPDYYELSPSALGLTPRNVEVFKTPKPKSRRRSSSVTTPKTKVASSIMKSGSASKSSPRKSVSFRKEDLIPPAIVPMCLYPEDDSFDFDAVRTPNISQDTFVSPLVVSEKLPLRKPTPARVRRTPKRSGVADLKDLKKLFAKSPKNDLTDLSGVKQLLASPKPRGNQAVTGAGISATKLKGLKKLFEKSPTNELSDLRGVKQLLASPKRQVASAAGMSATKLKGLKKLFEKSPTNELSDLLGVKQLLASPKPQVASAAGTSATKLKGLKRLFEKSPTNELSDLRGVKQLLVSPRQAKSPKNDLTNVRGVRGLFQKQKSPKNDYTDIRGMRTLFAAESSARDSDVTDLRGVRELFGLRQDADVTLTGVKELFSPASPQQRQQTKSRARSKVPVEISSEPSPSEDAAPVHRSSRRAAAVASAALQVTFWSPYSSRKKETPESKTSGRKRVASSSQVASGESPSRKVGKIAEGKSTEQSESNIVEAEGKEKLKVQTARPKRGSKVMKKATVAGLSPDSSEARSGGETNTKSAAQPKRKPQVKRKSRDNAAAETPPPKGKSRAKPAAETSPPKGKSRSKPAAETPQPKGKSRAKPAAETSPPKRKSRSKPAAETPEPKRISRSKPAAETPEGKSKAKPAAKTPEPKGKSRARGAAETNSSTTKNTAELAQQKVRTRNTKASATSPSQSGTKPRTTRAKQKATPGEKKSRSSQHDLASPSASPSPVKTRRGKTVQKRSTTPAEQAKKPTSRALKTTDKVQNSPLDKAVKQVSKAGKRVAKSPSSRGAKGTKTVATTVQKKVVRASSVKQTTRGARKKPVPSGVRSTRSRK